MALDVLSIGEALRRARNRHGYTLDQVCLETGIHAGHISRIERGSFKHLSTNVQKLQDFFGLTDAVETPEQLAERTSSLAARSSVHAKAIHAMLEMIEDMEG